MIVSEQDSETSLNRRKPRPPADAASIWIDWLIGMFQEPLDGAGTPYTGISPPAVLTGCPLCLRRLTAFQGRFNARTEAGQSYLPDMRVIAPKPATACLCAEGCSPYTSSLKLGSWPAQSRTAFLSGAYRMYPIDLFNSRTVASPHRCTVADTFVPNGGSVEICLKLSHIFGDRQKRKAAAPPFSLSVNFAGKRPECR